MYMFFSPAALSPQPMVVGFLSNKLTLRGTEIAMYDYADYNETYLNNKSIVITRSFEQTKNEMDTDVRAYSKFTNRFQVEYYSTISDIDNIVTRNNITHLYIIKHGCYDRLLSTKCKNLIHCVFNTTQPHGYVYSTVSPIVNTSFKTNVPVVPHMVRVHQTHENLRKDLNIPDNAIVFGRYGGAESFDIPFVKQCIFNLLMSRSRSDIFFLFMNTPVFFEHPQIIYLPGTTDEVVKRKFINTSDALLHARTIGETFGLTCGEFAVCMKPVITYSKSTDNNHLYVLQDKAVVYDDYESLFKILTEFTVNKYDMTSNGYLKYDYKSVMDIFKDTYLKI